MTRHDHFVLLVQTALLLRKTNEQQAIVTLAGAMAITEDALPQDLGVAALSWMMYQLGSNTKKPKWLAEYDEALASVVIFEQLDQGDAWWIDAERHLEMMNNPPAAWKKFVDGRDKHVPMTKLDADAFEEWARAIPEWDDTDLPYKRHEAGTELPAPPPKRPRLI